MRKTLEITIGADNCPSELGRDYGKTFHLTEMSAFHADEWANRAILALVPRLTRQVSPDVAEALQQNPDMVDVERIGMLLGGISFPEMKDLMRELMTCVQIKTEDPNMPLKALNFGSGDPANPYPVIEDIETLRFLRSEVLRLHTGFPTAAIFFNLIVMAASTPLLLSTATSRSPSAPLSPAA